MIENAVIFDYLGGLAPVQAEGTVAGNRFYFRSRYESWTFSLSEYKDISPVSIVSVDLGVEYGFFLEGRFGVECFEASYMPEEKAKQIIYKCEDMQNSTEWVRKIRKSQWSNL